MTLTPESEYRVFHAKRGKVLYGHVPFKEYDLLTKHWASIGFTHRSVVLATRLGATTVLVRDESDVDLWLSELPNQG